MEGGRGAQPGREAAHGGARAAARLPREQSAGQGRLRLISVLLWRRLFWLWCGLWLLGLRGLRLLLLQVAHTDCRRQRAP